MTKALKWGAMVSLCLSVAAMFFIIIDYLRIKWGGGPHLKLDFFQFAFHEFRPSIRKFVLIVWFTGFALFIALSITLGVVVQRQTDAASQKTNKSE